MMHALLPQFLPLSDMDPLEHVLDKSVLQFHGLWLLSNNIITLLISAAAMLIIFPLITRAYRRGEHVPTGTRNFFEAILFYIREDVARPVSGIRPIDTSRSSGRCFSSSCLTISLGWFRWTS